MKRYLPLNVPFLRIVSMPEIGRSGKPEANVGRGRLRRYDLL
jgi:hypothetical protein